MSGTRFRTQLDAAPRLFAVQPTMKEDELLRVVLELAEHLHWLRAHFRPALTRRGWRTAVQGDGKGFPDLVLLREGRMVVAELKGPRGRPSYEQLLWLAAFELVPQAEVFVWTPEDWLEGRIEAVLG